MKTNDPQRFIQVTVQRHALLYRILHWLIVLEVLLLLISGAGVSDYLPWAPLARGAARNLHIVLGLAWTGTITFFFYYFIISGEYRWFGLSRFGLAIDFLLHEVHCLIRGKKAGNPVRYDCGRGAYAEKVVPTEVLAWWGWFTLGLLMVLTGLALLFPANFGFINRVCLLLLPGFERAAAATRFLHFAVSLTMIAYGIIHAYASWKFGMIGSMISGMRQEQAVHPGSTLGA